MLLTDWVVSTLTALVIVLECVGWGSWLGRPFFRALPHHGFPLSFAFSMALGAQFYFLLSFLRISHPWLHPALALTGCVLFLLSARANALHFTLARLVSPKTWRRAWPWLLLPLGWFLLRFIDCLPPHQASGAGTSLLAARLWFEDGGQAVDALAPTILGTGIWEGLYTHAQALTHWIGASERSALVRGQITSQLLHFLAGQCVTLFMISGLISDLAPRLSARLKIATRFERHLGFAGPVSVCLAWIAVAHAGIPVPMGTAGHAWGAAMLSLAAVYAAVLHSSDALALFLLGSSLAVEPMVAAPAAPVVLGALIVFNRNAPRPQGSRFFGLLRATAWPLLALALGIGPWMARNHLLIGNFMGRDPGWLAPTSSPLGLDLSVFLVPALLIGAAWLVALELALHAFAQRRPFLRPAVSPFWLLMGILLVRMPAHVLWQDLAHGFRPSETFLSAHHPRFDAKLWASLHLPPNARIAWTQDDDGYYLRQRSASTPSSSALRDVLSQARTPKARGLVLCQLGFTHLAWDARRHGPEVAGLASWLTLVGSFTHAQTSATTIGDVSFFDLRGACR